MTDLITDKEQAAAFLSLFKHADPTSFIALRGILHRRPQKSASGVVLKESVQADRPDLLDHLWRASNRIANIPAPAAFYAPIATFKTGDSAKTRNTAQGLAASVECDEDAQRSLAKLTAVLGPPTLVVASGGRWTDAEGRTWPKLHLHWRLAKPATTKEELTLLYEARSLARQYVGADATCDPWVHPLRWSGSWHRKEGKAPTLVTVQSATENEVDLVAAVEALRLMVPNPERRLPGDAEAVPENLLGDPDDIAAAVAVIPNNDRPWQSWKRILLAIWAASEGDGYEVAEKWSAQSEKHDIDTFEDEWDSIPFSRPDRIGMGTLVYEAQLAQPSWTSPSFERARLAKVETFFEPVEEDQNVFPEQSNISTLMEDEAALQFAEENRGRLRFCFSHGAWFLWVDTHWQRDLTQRAFHWAREKARAMARDEHEKVRVQFGKMAFAAAVERGARADPALAVTADQWDSDPYLLGTPGGTVDLRTGKLRLSARIRRQGLRHRERASADHRQARKVQRQPRRSGSRGRGVPLSDLLCARRRARSCPCSRRPRDRRPQQSHRGVVAFFGATLSARGNLTVTVADWEEAAAMVMRAFSGVTLADIRRMHFAELIRWWERAREIIEGPEREAPDNG